MGLDTGAKWLIGALLGSSALGSIGGSGQELQSFEGEPGLDPADVMREFKSLLDPQMARALSDQASTPHVSTTVNPLPSFVGGGLPMPISVPGMDGRRLQKRLPSASPPKFLSAAPQPGGDGLGGGGDDDMQQGIAAVKLLLGGAPGAGSGSRGY